MSHQNKRTILCDIEANGLSPTRIWCVVCKDIITGEYFKFRPNTPYAGHLTWTEDFKKFVDTEVERFIGHNFIAYDAYWLNKLVGTKIHVKQIDDTLVLSKLFRPVTPFKEQVAYLKTDSRLGGHSLDAWGKRLGFRKTHFKDWDSFSEEMLEYCVNDVDVTHKVYSALLKESEGFSDTSIRLEHKVFHLLAQQERNGFYLDKDRAETLKSITNNLLKEKNAQLLKVFPPIPKLDKENYIAKTNKDGSLSKVSQKIMARYEKNSNLSKKLNKDGSYNLSHLETFNPNSSKQIAERLLLLGWVPKKHTPKGSPATDRDSLKEAIKSLLQNSTSNLEGLKHLNDYSMLSDRNQRASKWLDLRQEDGRVHGRIDPLGTSTHRCSHYNDNMANVASVEVKKTRVPLNEVQDKAIFSRLKDGSVLLEKEIKGTEAKITMALTGIDGGFGWESRECWAAPTPQKCIVGIDASGIQLRALAHYMDDIDYIDNLLNSDIHIVNGRAAGILDIEGNVIRSKAKTFIYAWLLGAGDALIGNLVGISSDGVEELIKEGKSTILFKNYTMLSSAVASLKRQKRKILKKDVAIIIKGAIVKKKFLDGTPALKRLKTKDIPEATQKGFLLGLDGRKLWIPSEHLAMSLYLQGFEAVIMKAAMCFYQKELHKLGIPFKQVAFVHDEFQVETDSIYGEIVGKTAIDSMIKAGEYFETKCPIDGEYKVGQNWAMTH